MSHKKEVRTSVDFLFVTLKDSLKFVIVISDVYMQICTL